MATMQTFGSSSLQQSSALNMMPTVCRCRGISSNLSSNHMEWGLPIALRGSFFNDSFFQNVRSNFDSAVQEMLSKWGQTGMMNDAYQMAAPSLANNFSLYRQLRSQASQEENKASTIVADNSSHKIVMDVHDFLGGDINVKILGENEVLVEGKEKTDSGSGAVSKRAFSRRFTFPSSVNMAGVTSVMSSDGVLTIEAPKSEGKDSCTKVESLGNAATQAQTETTFSDSASHNACSSNVSTDSKDTVYYCKGCNQKIGMWHEAPETKIAQKDGQKVPIKISGSLKGHSHNIPVTHDRPSELNTEAQSKDVRVERSENKQKINEQEKRETALNLASNEKSNSPVTANDLQSQSFMNRSTFEVPVTTPFSLLPIMRRGPFFSDSFFEDMHNDFQSAVQEVLSQWGSRSSFMDDAFSAYRNLRLCDLKEETQAAKTVEDDCSHKFVLDVQDFINGGEVAVKALNDREIVIEGHIEKGEGDSKSMKRFLKRFNVPGDIKLDSVTSVMSSDGILTITAPKKPSSIQLREVTIPVSLEGADKSDHCIKAQENSQSSSTSNTCQRAVTNQLNGAKEYIIPVNVEGSATGSISQNLSEQVKVQKECEERRSNNTQHMAQKLQENTSKEHIIPVNVEGASGSSKEAYREIKVENTSKEHIIPVNVEGASASSKEAYREIKVEKECQEKHSANAQQMMQKPIDMATKGHIIPVNVEGFIDNSKNDSHKINVVHESIEKQSESAKQQLKTSQETAKQQLKTSQETAKHQMSSTTEKMQAQPAANKTDSTFKQGNLYQLSQKNRNVASNDGLACALAKRYLPISRKGLFFDDSFFQDYQSNFQTAIRDVLVKSRQWVDKTDDMTAYRSLRQRDLKVENQALHVQENQESLKIVVDAKDFVNGDITVCIDGEELVIEGRAENSETKSSNSLTFSHRFLLPEHADISTITSAISSDGVLTVNSPKSGDPSSEAMRGMSSEVNSKHESHSDGGHKFEEKRVKESSEQGNGFSARRYSSSYSSQQQQSSAF